MKVHKQVTELKIRGKIKEVPDQEHKQRGQVHALDVQAVLQVPHKTSRLYDNTEQNPYLDLCVIVQVQTNFSQ